MHLSKISIELNGNMIDFSYREDSIGDKGVIGQIFNGRDYDITRWVQGRKLLEYHNEHSKLNPSLIIDAGANIGASAVFFLEEFKNSFLYCIEPEINNFNILQKNTEAYTSQIKNFNGAISEKDGILVLEDPNQSDWAFRTKAVSPGTTGLTEIKSISPYTILSDEIISGFTPLIFKVDIEGGEENLFSGNIDWVNKFPLIIIELHDWMLPFSGSSRSFLKAAASFDFDFVYRGENIFLFNRAILAG